MSGPSDRTRLMREFRARIGSLSERELILFGGKGGVGKTTTSLLTALHFARKRNVTIVTTDPAGNLADFRGDLPPRITLESIDAEKLWREFLDQNIESLLELGDRGTYLEREDLRRFFELSIPGVDELMGWSHITRLVLDSENPLVIVDTAPTGHTTRLLTSGGHWHAMELVLESMQEKHREIVSHLTRRSARDALDDFLDRFSSTIVSSEELLSDPRRTAFVPVFTAEPWVVDQTLRLAGQLQDARFDVPFGILNHAAVDCDCTSCERRLKRERAAAMAFSGKTVLLPRACSLFRSIEDLESHLTGRLIRAPASERASSGSRSVRLGPPDSRLSFVAGKGGVGKTTIASAMALAATNRDEKVVLLSVDPAHSVRDVFSRIAPPQNLVVETIDTRAAWMKLEEEIGESIRRAISNLTPKGFQNVHDETITRQLLEISPPGADEIFALIRIVELWGAPSVSRIIVDTAPTGHFLRLLDLPRVAGEWVRELMRLTLRYKEILSSTSLGEQLLNASRSLREFESLLEDRDCSAIVVARPEPVVIDETLRLIDAVGEKGITIAAVVVNATTPENDCDCDRRRRLGEMVELDRFGQRNLVLVSRRDQPPVTRKALEGLLGSHVY